MTDLSKHRIRIEVADRLDLEAKLEEAAEALMSTAHEHRDRGILITRSSPHEYYIELHPHVPFGTTYERCEWTTGPRRWQTA